MKVATIRQTKFIRAEPDEVYNAFINGKIHAAFTGAKATCNAKVGGKFTAWNGYITGKNLKLKKGKLIVQQWKTKRWPKGYPYSILEFTFKPEKGGTRVRMVQSNVPASQAANYRQGWVESYWSPLRRYFQARKSGTRSKI
jgi:activator of HSP90 ATPase